MDLAGAVLTGGGGGGGGTFCFLSWANVIEPAMSRQAIITADFFIPVLYFTVRCGSAESP